MKKRHPQSTIDTVLRLYGRGYMKYREIAEEVGLTLSQVSSIIRNHEPDFRRARQEYLSRRHRHLYQTDPVYAERCRSTAREQARRKRSASNGSPPSA